MIYSIIPSKVNSERLPGKNTFGFCLYGKPLIEYTIIAVKGAGIPPAVFTDEVIENKILKEMYQKYSLSHRKRPANTTLPESTMKDTVFAAIKEWSIKGDDIILLTYLTCPLRTSDDIKDALNYFKQTNARSLQSLTEVRYRPYGLMKKAESKEGKFFCMQNQGGCYQYRNTAPLYKANGAIYIFYASELNELNNQMFNDDTIGFTLEPEHGIDIDTEMDVLLVEALLRKRESEILKTELTDEHFVSELSGTGKLKTEYNANWTIYNIKCPETSRT